MPKTFDLTLVPLYRVNGNELPSLPGLLGLTPPRRKARSRARDLLIVHLALSGNADSSTAIYHQLTSAAAAEFYQTSGSVTSALRAAATTLNGDLLERNMAASGQGRYSLANLILCVVRDEHLYILESGPGHVYWMLYGERQDIHDPEMAGRGLGLGQATTFYLSQLKLSTGGRLLISPKLSAGWETILERDNTSASLETLRSGLMRQSMEDQNAVLLEMQFGRGEITMLKPPPSHKPTYESVSKKIAEEPEPEIVSHQPEPQVFDRETSPAIDVELERKTMQERSVLASIPRQNPELVPEHKEIEEKKNSQERPVFDSAPRQETEPVAVPKEIEEKEFQEERSVLDSIPKQESAPASTPERFEERKTLEKNPILGSIPHQESELNVEPEEDEEIIDENIPSGPPISEVIARQSARTLAKGMRATRDGNSHVKGFFRKMMPRLLPADNPDAPLQLPKWVMALIAVIIPLVVVTIASVVYFRFGRDIQYENAFAEVEIVRSRALEQVGDPIAERRAWDEVLLKLDNAEQYDSTVEIDTLRAEAQNYLDVLLGILRLNFRPAVIDLPRGLNITAMTVTETELFMLDATTGEILRAFLTGDGFQFDATTFICRGGDYGGISVGTFVELQALPKANALAASVMGVDAQGNLLYCAANQVPQASSLYRPSVGIKEVTAIALDGDILYLLDAASNEVWIYNGRASAFIDYPTAFFEQAPQGGLENAVDMSVTGSDLYLLFNDGHLASCTSSLLDSVPTRCVNPVQLVDPHPAAGGGNSFGQDIFAEMLISTPPDAALLLLAPEIQAIYRFSPRSFSLQNQFHPIKNSLSSFVFSAMATSPSHVIFVAQGNQIYEVTDIP